MTQQKQKERPMLQLRILLGVCGGVAAYKSVELARRLQEKGVEVRVVMTRSATKFISPLTFQSLTRHKVYDDLFDGDVEDAMGHIDLARWANLIVVAPATANMLAQLANGMANDLLSTLCLASISPLVVAPAMNQMMWEHPATQHNLKILQQRGVYQLGPGSGIQACGEIGWGRLLEPEQMAEEIFSLFSSRSLEAKSVLITAGPTREAIDPIRFISNRSSGKMGYALARSARDAGANVTLISGPVDLIAPSNVKIISIETALDMQKAVMDSVPAADIFISAAAVSDYRPVVVEKQKIKKSSEAYSLELIPNPDVLSEVSSLKKKPFIVGFAAETQQMLDHAKNKLIKKQLDMIIANKVGVPDQGFETDNNEVTAITKEQEIHFPLQNKQQLSRKLIELIAEKFKETKQ